MSLENKTLKQLKAMAKTKQQKDCPSYSKMTKKQIIDYLSDSKLDTPVDSLQLAKKRLSPRKPVPQTDALRYEQIMKGVQKDKQDYSPIQREPSNLSGYSFVDYPQKVKKKTKKKTVKRPQKKSSDPYGFDQIFKEDQKGYKVPKVHKMKSSDPYGLEYVFKEPVQRKKRTVKQPKKISGTTDSLKNMRVADLRKECKRHGLKTSGKKSELISRLRQKQNFNKARGELNKKLKSKNSITSAEKRVAKQLQDLLS